MGIRRLRKGCKVEVWNCPPGAWRPGTITSINCRSVVVRYDHPNGMTDEHITEKVPRKAIRPCPPEVDGEHWASGDLVEVFDGIYWKAATILRSLSLYFYLVRAVDSLEEIQIKRSNMRVCQSWINGEWTIIRKGYSRLDILNYGQPCLGSRNTGFSKKRRVCAATRKNCSSMNPNFMEPYTKTLKSASPFCSTIIDIDDTRACKKVTRKTGEGYQPRYPPSIKTIDAVHYPHENLIKNSSTSGNIWGYEVPEKLSRDVDTFTQRGYQHSINSDNECSVGSCSVPYSSPNSLLNSISGDHIHTADMVISDAESSYKDEGETLNVDDKIASGVHKLELHAYRCTLEALHASGPLSWEQETLLTNLRLSLNISNDEHLSELRDLISTGNR